MAISHLPTVYVVSDSLGETAEFVARAAASQFNSGRVEIHKIPYVSELEHLLEIVEEAAGSNAMIAYTLVIPELRRALVEKCREKGITAVDILGPMMDAISDASGKASKNEPGLVHKVDEQYFRRVEAIEFAVKYDDGKDPRGIIYADIVLVGVSRTSKTPLCMYLAHKRIKAANIPLVPEVAAPDELFSLSAKKVVGLTVRPQILYDIRQERLKSLGLAANADYANLNRILQELEYAESVMKRIGCPIVDVSNKAVEETSSKILEIFYKGERHGR